MKRLLILGFVSIGLVSAACQRPAARTADAGAPSPTPPAASPMPAEASPAPVVARPAEATSAAERPSLTAKPQAGARPEPATRVPAAAPAGPVAPAPTPTPRPRIVAAGTALSIVLQQAVSTRTAQAEDPVLAQLGEDVVVDGELLLPRASEVRGHVVSAQRSGRVKGRARLVVSFEELRVEGTSYPIQATGFDVSAGSSKGKDAKIAGGSAAAGAIIGGIAGGGSGALKGGLIGGAVGGGAVLATRGVEVELKAGTPYKIELKKSLHVR